MLSTALARWQGDALADLAYESWATPVAERLEELRLVAAELRIEAMLSGAEHQGDRRDPFASGCPSIARIASRSAPAGTHERRAPERRA